MYAAKAVHAINTDSAKMSLNAGTAQFAAEAKYATNAMVSKVKILKAMRENEQIGFYFPGLL